MKTKVSDQDISLRDASEFHLGMTDDAKENIWSWLHGELAVDAYERGIMCVLTRSPGRRRLTYLVRKVIPPEDGDINLFGGVEFSRDYRQEVKERADTQDGGVLYLHTHPGGDGAPNKWDVDTGRRLLHNDAQHLDHPNPPLGIGIVTPEDNWMILGCEYPDGTSVSQGEPRYATAVRVIGDQLEKQDTYSGGREVTGAAGAIGTVDPETQDRQIRLWTREAQETYAGLRVGIVGLGGGGSVLAEHIARAGVDGLILADYDVIKDENLNRQQGATSVDSSVWRPKVKVAARTARRAATNPDFDVQPVRASVVEDDPDISAYRELLDCDVILHAADGHWTTQVLDRIAYAHLIPIVSGGTRPETGDDGVLKATSKSPIMISAPGYPCFRCCLQYRPKLAEKERHRGRDPGPDYDLDGGDWEGANVDEPDEAEDDPDEGPAPSVISLNTIVAGMMHLRLQDLTLGVTGHVVGERRYLPGSWEFQRGRAGCRSSCNREEIVATGQGHSLPLSTDHEFARVRDEIDAPSSGDSNR